VGVPGFEPGRRPWDGISGNQGFPRKLSGDCLVVLRPLSVVARAYTSHGAIQWNAPVIPNRGLTPTILGF
jgi:hypothetical protein